jgi:ornithine cyclodeaminase
MLILSRDDIRQAASCLEIVDSVEQAFIRYESGDFMMPARMHLDHQDSTLLLMPCLAGDHIGTKLVSVHPSNAGSQLPVINGIMVLNDSTTGAPLAVLEGSELTARRTGAVGAVAIRHLAAEDVHSLGLIGAGVQGLNQADFACAVRRFTDIHVHDIDERRVEPFLAALAERRPDIRLHRCDSVTDLLVSSQVVITATTSAAPVLPEDKELLAGRHYIAIGSYKPDMTELPESLLTLTGQVFLDTEHAKVESGDIAMRLASGIIRDDQLYTIGKLITGRLDATALDRRTTLFKSVGMALLDVQVAGLLHHNATARQLGTTVDF